MEMMKLGPLGNTCWGRGTKWEEVCSDRISHIFVSFDDRGVTSIQFGYVKNGALVLSTKHGSSNGISTRIVRLNHVSEFVTGITGECFQGVIISLTFHTNQRTHEAFRSTTHIVSQRIICSNKMRELHSGILDQRELAGFFGSWSSSRLSSIGLYIKPILTGTSVRLSHDEYVTGLSGIYFLGNISSLTFHTNLGKHGPFCEYLKSPSDIKEYTREISVIRDRCEFGGFFGSFNDLGYLTSIGIYFRPTISFNDAVLGTKFGDTYDHERTLNQTWDPIANRTLDHQIPEIVDGFPVKSIRYKPKLKDRILSKLDPKRALLFLLRVFFD